MCPAHSTRWYRGQHSAPICPRYQRAAMFKPRRFFLPLKSGFFMHSAAPLRWARFGRALRAARKYFMSQSDDFCPKMFFSEYLRRVLAKACRVDLYLQVDGLSRIAERVSGHCPNRTSRVPPAVSSAQPRAPLISFLTPSGIDLR